MDNTKVNETLEDFSRKYISPKQEERDLITKRYKFLKRILPGNQIFQSGSYKRETSITPVHDLDVILVMPEEYQEEFLGLYKSGNPEDFSYSPIEALNNLKGILESGYEESNEIVEIMDPQTHSIKIKFGEKKDEDEDDRFSIDVVPAVKSGKRKKDKKGEHDIYFVPEIQKAGKGKWQSIYESAGDKMRWILSDPKSYLHLSQKLNLNPDFRKAVKFIKVWKNSCNAGLIDFELKSFHLELIMMDIFKNQPDSNFIEAVAEFFYTLDRWLDEPIFLDEADDSVFVDEYLNDDITGQKQKALAFAKKTISIFEKFSGSTNDDDLYYLLRQSLIPMAPWNTPDDCFDKINITCVKELRDKDKLKQPPRPKHPTTSYFRNTFSRYDLDAVNTPKPITSGERIKPGYDLRFYSNLDKNIYDEIRWLVVNNGIDALNKANIRGWRGNKFEESEEGTSGRKEYTSYYGNHYVECFAVKDGVCQKHGRFDVNIVENP